MVFQYDKFVPFKGIGPLFFGQKRRLVRTLIKDIYTEFRRSALAHNSSDYYENLGVFIEYNIDNLLEAIEFTDDCTLLYKEANILSMTYSSLRSVFDKLSAQIEVEHFLEKEVGVVYHDLGFSVSKKRGCDYIETILIFERRYW